MTYPLDYQRNETALVVVTHARDAAFATLCLRSISRFASGFARAMMFVPTRDRPVFAPLTGLATADGVPIELLDYHEGPERGHFAHQFVKCCADFYCPECQWFAFLDADSIFTRPVTSRDYFTDGGKAILLAAPYAAAPNGVCWLPGVAHALGTAPELECMQWPQIIHHRLALAAMRLHIVTLHRMPFWHYVMNERMQADGVTPMAFAEFPLMGAVSQLTEPLRANYRVFLTSTPEAEALPRFIKQGWSWSYQDPVRHAHELAEFARIVG